MKFDGALYTVVIGDISGSKQLSGENRYQTQLFIKSALVQINEQYQAEIEAPFTISKGDEFQVLLPTLEQAYKIILAFERLTFPIRVRFGIGVGTVLKMGGKLPIEMDGPAFHRANTALETAKKKKTCYTLNTGEEIRDSLVNTIFRLMSAIKSRWNERHHRLYWNYQSLGTYREVAASEKVTPQAICDVLKTMRAADIREAERCLTENFRHFDSIFFHSRSPLEDEEIEKAR